MWFCPSSNDALGMSPFDVEDLRIDRFRTFSKRFDRKTPKRNVGFAKHLRLLWGTFSSCNSLRNPAFLRRLLLFLLCTLKISVVFSLGAILVTTKDHTGKLPFPLITTFPLQSMLNYLLSVSLSARFGTGWSETKECLKFNFKGWFSILILMVFFRTAHIMSFVAINYLDLTTLSILRCVRPLIAAVISYLFLPQYPNHLQTAALCSCALGITQFMMEKHSGEHINQPFGFILALASSTIVVAGLVAQQGLLQEDNGKKDVTSSLRRQKKKSEEQGSRLMLLTPADDANSKTTSEEENVEDSKKDIAALKVGEGEMNETPPFHPFTRVAQCQLYAVIVDCLIIPISKPVLLERFDVFEVGLFHNFGAMAWMFIALSALSETIQVLILMYSNTTAVTLCHVSTTFVKMLVVVISM